MRQIAAISPLRGLAALLVLLSHVAFWTGEANVDVVGRLLARGDSGVAVFFAISAFLLTRRHCAGRGATPSYWRKRAARILPHYWLALVVVLVVTATLHGAGALGGSSRVVAHVFVAQGYTQRTYRGFTQTWSLTTELTFYALVPFVGAWLGRCVRQSRSPLPLLGIVGAASLVVQTASASSGHAQLGAVSTSVIGHAAWFCAGIAVAWICDGPRSRRLAPPGRWIGWALVVYVLAATPLGGPLDLSRPAPWQAFGKEALYTVLAACLLLAAVQASGHAETLAASNAGSRLGDLSYGVFLWHVLVLDVLFSSLGLTLFHASFMLVLVVVLVVSVALAALGRGLVEEPAIAWSHRARPPARAGRGRQR